MLDKFDLKILVALQSDGRMPTARLAERVGLTTNPTWERVRKLEASGILRGFHADLAVERLTPLTVVLVPVALEDHRAQACKRFEQAIEKVPQIVECWAVVGEVDYVLRIAVPAIDDYQVMIEQLLGADLGIQRYWSYVVTKPVKPFAGIPIAQLLGGQDTA